MSYGKRIKFQKHDHILISHKIYSNGQQMVRLMIDTQDMVYKIVDPVTGHALETGGEGLTNFEVLQRNAKKALQKFLNIKFDKEYHNAKPE